jgi:hypothetical protein
MKPWRILKALKEGTVENLNTVENPLGRTTGGRSARIAAANAAAAAAAPAAAAPTTADIDARKDDCDDINIDDSGATEDELPSIIPSGRFEGYMSRSYVYE